MILIQNHTNDFIEFYNIGYIYGNWWYEKYIDKILTEKAEKNGNI